MTTQHTVKTKEYRLAKGWGIPCPVCSGKSHKVVNSRPAFRAGVGIILRRRRCKDCGEHFSTSEIVWADMEKAAGEVKKSALSAALKVIQEELERE